MITKTYNQILSFLKENELYEEPLHDDSRIMCEHGEHGILVRMPAAASRSQGAREVILVTATTVAIYYKNPPTNYSSLCCYASRAYENQEELKTTLQEWLTPDSGCWK